MYIKCLSIALVIQLNSSPLFIDLDVSQDWGLTVIIAKMDKTLYYIDYNNNNNYNIFE